MKSLLITILFVGASFSSISNAQVVSCKALLVNRMKSGVMVRDSAALTVENPFLASEIERFKVLTENEILQKLVRHYFKPAGFGTKDESGFEVGTFWRDNEPYFAYAVPSNTIFSRPITVTCAQQGRLATYERGGFWGPKFTGWTEASMTTQKFEYDPVPDRIAGLKRFFKPNFFTGRSDVVKSLSASEIEALWLIVEHDPSPQVRDYVRKFLP